MMRVLAASMLAACGGGGGGARGSGADAPPAGSGAVLFADDFESGGFGAWQQKDGEADKYRITSDAALVHTGSGALDVTIRSDWSSGQLNAWFDAADEIHVTMDIMFSAGWDQTGTSSRHLLQLSGNHMDMSRFGEYPDSSFGRAGETPDGSDFFWIHLTSWNDNAWYVGYAHPDQTSQWGDGDFGSVDVGIGAYQRLVFHARLNTLGASDGFWRLSIDGAVVGERTGLAWRTTDRLVFNSFGLQAYYINFPATAHVYIDNLVVRAGPPP